MRTIIVEKITQNDKEILDLLKWSYRRDDVNIVLYN